MKQNCMPVRNWYTSPYRNLIWYSISSVPYWLGTDMGTGTSFKNLASHYHPWHNSSNILPPFVSPNLVSMATINAIGFSSCSHLLICDHHHKMHNPKNACNCMNGMAYSFLSYTNKNINCNIHTHTHIFSSLGSLLFRIELERSRAHHPLSIYQAITGACTGLGHTSFLSNH